MTARPRSPLLEAIIRDGARTFAMTQRQAYEWGEALWTAPELADAARRDELERERRLIPVLLQHGARPT